MSEKDFIHTQSYKLYTKILKETEKQSYNAIKQYCEENNIIPNLIDEEKLKEVLRLGIAEYSKRMILGDKENE